VSEAVTVEALVARFPEEWRAATRHAFLDAVRDGRLPDTAFATWIAQDYLFVADLLVFQARLLARAPRSAQAVIASGVAALEAELTWFEHRRARHDVERLQATERYRALLEALDAAAYPVASVGLWAIERAYLDAWQSAAPGAKAYSEFVEHWTVPEFATYVDGLAGAANQALSVATPDEQAEAVATFLAVARLEADFWQMAYTQS
jgi:thiaminase